MRVIKPTHSTTTSIERQNTHSQRPAARRDGLEEVHRRVLALPRVLAIARSLRRSLRQRAPDPLERQGGRRALAVGADADERLDDVSGSLARRRDLGDLQLSADVFERGVLERLDVARAEREVRHDDARDEPAYRVVRLEDVAIGAGAYRGRDEAERLGYQLVRPRVVCGGGTKKNKHHLPGRTRCRAACRPRRAPTLL